MVRPARTLTNRQPRHFYREVRDSPEHRAAHPRENARQIRPGL